jgi:dephospho-CoA kinase
MAAQASGLDLVVADVPLLFEAGLQEEFDRIVLVDAPEGTRLTRLLSIRGLDRDEAKRMIASQLPVERKRERADYLVENSGTLSELRERATAVWRELEEDAAREGGAP